MRDTSEYLLDELRESHDSSYTIQEIFSQKYDIMIRYLWSRIYEEMNTPRDRQNVEAVLQVSIKANDELYREIRRDANMCDALRELMKDDIEREVSAARKLGESEGEVRGKAMGEVVGEAKIILKMNRSGMSTENIASITGKDLDEINAILEGRVPVLS